MDEHKNNKHSCSGKNLKERQRLLENAREDYASSLRQIFQKSFKFKVSEEKGPLPTILHVPDDFPSITEAVAAASPGDTIFVKSGVYHESVTIPSKKASLRIIANGNRVILYGKDELKYAFNVLANNVVLQGFTIFQYLKSGIRVSRVFGTKLMENNISEVAGDGIELNLGTYSTLIWKNRITKIGKDGIHVRGKNTWMVKNEVSGNGGNGVYIGCAGNQIIENRIYENGHHGIEDAEGFNFISGNHIVGNRKDGLYARSGIGGAAILQNKVARNRNHGLELITDGNIVLDNVVNANGQTGTNISGHYNHIQQNTLNVNREMGVKILSKASQNLLLRNNLRGNRPLDIECVNANNGIIQNQCYTSNPHRLSRSIFGSTILNVPDDYSSISAAVAAARSGDTIIVKNGEYDETVSIPSSKHSVRILARGEQVILNGKNQRNTAFTINANHVEIEGFTIQNYVTNAIFARGIGIKLLKNRIHGVKHGNGIRLLKAFSTLIWKNQITGASRDGIHMVAMNSWIVDNEIWENRLNGVHQAGMTSVGSLILNNRIINNSKDGVLSHTGFNFIMNNDVTKNGRNGVYLVPGADHVGIMENLFYGNHGDGINIESHGVIAVENLVKNNQLNGMQLVGLSHHIDRNAVTANHRSGLMVLSNSKNQLIFQNKLSGNNLYDLNKETQGNIIDQNWYGTMHDMGIESEA